MPDYSKLAKGLSSLMRGTQEVLPLAEREANKARFLEPSKAPMRLYHGTTATEGGKGQEAIRRIKPSKEGSLGSGVYLTPSPAHASGYSGIPNDEAITSMLSNPYHAETGLKALNQRNSGAILPSQEGGNMLPVYAQLRNPLVLEGKGDPMIEALIKLGMDEDKATRMVERAYENKGYIGKEVETRARAAGYDGLMQYRNGDLSEVVSYNPNAVKSAIGNKGTYDMTKPDINEAKGGAIRMQVGGLTALSKLGKAGTRLTPAEEAALRARGMGIPGKDFADPLAAPGMRMSEALGAAGAEGKYLNFTEADRSRVFGPNRGGVGFSALQHYSEPHKQAGTVWGFGNQVTAQKKLNQNNPENTIWTTYAGSPEQHKSNTVVVKDAVATLQAADKAGKVSPEQIRFINERIRQATNQNGKPIFPEGFDITDPNAMSHATTFDRRTAISDALMGVGVKKPMISKEFKKANPGVVWQDASNISNILARETDPALVGANTFDVGPHFFVMDNKIIHRPDLNEAFPVQVTGQDLGLRFKPAPFRSAAPDFAKQFPEGEAINAWKMSRGNPRQFVSEEYLTNLQKEGHKDGGTVTSSFTQRLQSAIETHMAAGGEVSDNTMPDMTDGGQINYGGQYAKGGEINVPVRSLRGRKKHFDDGGYVDPLGAPSAASGDISGLERAKRIISQQLSKEGAALSTPEGRKDVALKIASTLPGMGLGGDLIDLVDLVQSMIPGLNKPASVMDTEGTGDKVAKYPLRGLINTPSSKVFQDKFKEMNILGETEAPVTEFAGMLLAPGALAKAPRAIEGGLNRATAAARRGSTPAMLTAEAVAPDLGQFKSSEFQNYLTKKLIMEEGAPVGMTTMGGQKTQKFPGQGLYVNKAGEFESNPMVGVSIPRAGNLSKNKPLLADIATAGQELGQEAMAAHRFVPMMTNQIKDATSMMITGAGGKPLTPEQVKALASRMPDMIVSHSPQTGGLFLAPYSPGKGIQPEFLEAQKAVQEVLGKGAKIQYGRTDPAKDLLYFGDYAEKGARAPSAESQAMRKTLKSMDVGFPRKPARSPSNSGGLNQVPANAGG